MGYYTRLDGEFKIEPPLNADEVSFLVEFAGSRRMDRELGPLYVKGGPSDFSSVDVRDGNRPPTCQPSLWCPWEFSVDGIHAPEEEGKHYNSVEWLAYLVKNLLGPEARDYVDEHMAEDARLHSFTCDHTVTGTVHGQGEEADDHWKVSARDGKVFYTRSVRSWGEEKEILV